MTKDRKQCGIPENKAGDKMKFVDKDTGNLIEKTFVAERVITDSDGFIIGVEKKWQ